MGFIMDGLNAEAYDRSYSDRALVGRIVDYFRPHARTMVIVAGMVVLAALAETIIPVVISRGIDALAGHPTAQLALALGGIVLVLGSLGWFFNFVRQSFSARAVGDVVLALREDAFAAVMERDLSFYDQFSSGKIVSRVTSDTQDFSTVVTLTIDLMSQFLLVLIISIVLFTIDTGLALLVLTVTPVVFAAALGFRRIARWTTQRGQRATAEVNAAIQETVSGIAVAKSFRQEAAIYADFRDTNRLAYRVRLLRGLVINTIFPTLDIITEHLPLPAHQHRLVLEPVPAGALRQRARVRADRRRAQSRPDRARAGWSSRGPDHVSARPVQLRSRGQGSGVRGQGSGCGYFPWPLAPDP